MKQLANGLSFVAAGWHRRGDGNTPAWVMGVMYAVLIGTVSIAFLIKSRKK